MDKQTLLEKYERRRAEAARHGARAPVAKLYGVVIDELRQLDGEPEPGRMVTTAVAAEMLSVSPKTVRRWLQDDRFPGATKTSEGGEWRIPARDVYRVAGSEPQRSTPRLWEPGD